MSNRPPHICFVAPHAYAVLASNEAIERVGGAELQQVIVAKALAERGYRVSFICLNVGQDELVEIEGIKVFRAYRLDQGLPGTRFLWPRFTGIWNCLKRVDADIYYQRAAARLTGIVSAFCRQYGRKSVFAAAGNPDLEFRTTRIQHWWDRRIYEYGLRHVDRIFVQNEQQLQLCRRTVGRNAVLVPNCYPAPTRDKSRSGGYVLWVSMFRTLKQPGLFLDLAEALPQYKFRMIGGPAGGDRFLFDAMKARAQEMPNVEFVGFVPYSHIDEHFDSASLFVNTSESEGFPNTFLQAWSRGIPTVSFIDSGARLEGKPVGRIVASQQDMITSVDELLSNRAVRQDEAARCVKYFELSHSPDRVLALYEKEFRELLTEGHQRGRGRSLPSSSDERPGAP